MNDPFKAVNEIAYRANHGLDPIAVPYRQPTLGDQRFIYPDGSSCSVRERISQWLARNHEIPRHMIPGFCDMLLATGPDYVDRLVTGIASNSIRAELLWHVDNWNVDNVVGITVAPRH